MKTAINKKAQPSHNGARSAKSTIGKHGLRPGLERLKLLCDRRRVELVCITILLLAGSAVIFTVFTIFGTQPLVFAGGDFAFHVSRLLGTLDALKDGQLIPQVAPMVHDGLGMGFNIFYGQIFPYCGVLLYAILRNWPLVINVLFCALYLGIGLSCWFSVRHITRSNFIGLISGLAFMLATGAYSGYYYVFAGFTPGMAAAYIGLPLLVAGVYGVLYDRKKSIRLIIIGACFLILNSVLGAVLSLACAGIIALCHWKKLFTKKHLSTLLIALLAILGLTAFYALPMLEAKNATDYASYVPGYMSSNLDTANSVPSLSGLFNWTYSRYDTNQGMPLHFLLALVGAIVLLVVMWRRKRLKTERARLVFSLVVAALVGLVLISPIIPWRDMPLATTIFQYTGRLNLIFLFPTAVLFGILFGEVRQKIRFQSVISARSFAIACVAGVVCLSWIGISYPNSKMITGMSLNPDASVAWGYNALNDSGADFGIGGCDYLPIALVYYLFDTDIDLSGQSEPGYTACRFGGVSDRVPTTPTVLSGSASVNNFQKQGTHETMEITSGSDGGLLELPATYYPGYVAILNGETLSVSVSEKGLVQVSIPADASGTLQVYYGVSPATAAGTIISASTVVICTIFVVYRKKKQSEPSSPKL